MARTAMTGKYIALTSAAALIAVGAVMTALQKTGKGYDKRAERTFFAMDTACTVTVYGDGGCADDLKEFISRLDGSLSAYSESSCIYKLNSGEKAAADEYTKELLGRCVDLSRLFPAVNCTSGRLIDLWDINGGEPKIPSDEEIAAALKTVGYDNIKEEDGELFLENGCMLNFGCCAKGYALDKVRQRLENSDCGCAVVSFGSSSLLYGQKPDGSPFEVAVADPDDPQKNVLTVKLGSCCLSTSGGYERFFEADGKKYSHIFDLGTGYPAVTDLKSVTVISESDGLLTDFLSTCIFIGGTESLESYLDMEDIYIIAIDDKHQVYCSQQLKDDIEIIDPDMRISG